MFSSGIAEIITLAHAFTRTETWCAFFINCGGSKPCRRHQKNRAVQQARLVCSLAIPFAFALTHGPYILQRAPCPLPSAPCPFPFRFHAPRPRPLPGRILVAENSVFDGFMAIWLFTDSKQVFLLLIFLMDQFLTSNYSFLRNCTNKNFPLSFFSAFLSYNPSVLNGFGRVTQSRSSELALTLTALVLGLAFQQGSTNEEQETSSRDDPEPEPETTSR